MVISHRGIDIGFCPFPESTIKSFDHELRHDIGIEFDISFTRDGQTVVFHDSDILRATSGRRDNEVIKLDYKELLSIIDKNNLISTLDEVLELIRGYPKTINALHLKGKFQNSHYLHLLINKLKNHNLENIVVFDVVPETAAFLLNHISSLNIAPSVSHDYDIERFNGCVGGTLLSVDEVLKNKSVFSWVWLDEWDLKDKYGNKEFINDETINIFRKNNMKIGLVSPELHGTSPSLLGGESHEDALTQSRLFSRISKINSYYPDLICSDHASFIKAL